jgi:uncharacterized protein YjbI with pentapeptide repeats
MKIEIKCRFSGSVLFAHEAEGNTLKVTLEAACQARANLAGAYLAGAYLAEANLAGANLARAYLDRANLAGAYLVGAYLPEAYLAGAYLAEADLARANLADAYLARAYLAGAYLAGAYLDRANLAGAYLGNGEKLVGERPIVQIGPIGSRCAYVTAYLTDQGLRFDAGCQRQITREIFELRLANEHGDNVHAKEYRAALALIDMHAELWTPKV